MAISGEQSPDNAIHGYFMDNYMFISVLMGLYWRLMEPYSIMH